LPPVTLVRAGCAGGSLIRVNPKLLRFERDGGFRELRPVSGVHQPSGHPVGQDDFVLKLLQLVRGDLDSLPAS
jgi:hypothetical protein